MIAEVIINSAAKKLNKTFDYHIPKDLEDFVYVGTKVLVPFGKMKQPEEAHVVGIKEKSTFDLKDILKVENELTDEQVNLSKWMAKKYFCNLSECIKLMQVPGMRTRKIEKRISDKKINVVYLAKNLDEIKCDIEKNIIKTDKQKNVLSYVILNQGCTIQDIEKNTDGTRAIVNTLVKKGYLKFEESKIERNPLINKNIEKTNNLKLTDEQELAFNKIKESINKNKFEEFLLYGVTGSRKNRSIFTIN